MKTDVKHLLPALIASFAMILPGCVEAQTFRVLHSFTALNNATNSDGASPNTGLISAGGTLYGTAPYGGITGNGTVFKIQPDGTGFTVLESFSTGSNGISPYAELVSASGTLYGTADGGGNLDNGTVFALSPDGTGFTNLHIFNSTSDGAYPSGLFLSSNTLYGTSSSGGSWGAGTVFKFNTDGTGFTNLHNFTFGDGAFPYDGLILSGDTLYGTTSAGGGNGSGGTVFKIKTDGSGFAVLKTFSDGGNAQAKLVLSGDTLYGAAADGGSLGLGTIFKINTDGTGFTNLYNFSALISNTNADGAAPYPFGGLVLSGGTLFGTASVGGGSGKGTVFAVNTDGTGFTNLHSFTGSSDGANPDAGLILLGNTLYGTTSVGWSSGSGTIFSLSFAPQLTITPSGTNVILAWPTNYVGFDYTGYTLQSTTNLVSPAFWTNVSPGQVVVDGQNTVTSSIFGTQQYFRLKQ